MNSSQNHNPEAAPKRETANTSIEHFIAKKKAEKSQEGMREVQQNAEGVQSDVADIMAGVEKPAEKISERKEGKSDGDLKTGGSAQGDGVVGEFTADMTVLFPNEEVMVKKIRAAIKRDITVEIKRSKKLQKNLANGGTYEYNQSIAKIRRLTELLASLLHATVDAVKGVYAKYFTPSGKRRGASEG